MEKVIPKIIHYCWFGANKLPELAEACIASWKKYLPDYEIKEWNEKNFDISITPYVQEAYAAKKYAFVSDYARFWILYHYGGLYFDTDVEIIRPLDHIIQRGPFMGIEGGSSIILSKEKCEKSIGVSPGLGIGAFPKMELYGEILNLYANLHFRKADGRLNIETVVSYTTKMLNRYQSIKNDSIQNIAGIWIYPEEYFSPINIKDNQLRITQNTVSIHHYAASWTSPSHRLLRKIVLCIGGPKLKSFLSKYKGQ